MAIKSILQLTKDSKLESKSFVPKKKKKIKAKSCDKEYFSNTLLIRPILEW